MKPRLIATSDIRRFLACAFVLAVTSSLPAHGDVHTGTDAHVVRVVAAQSHAGKKAPRHAVLAGDPDGVSPLPDVTIDSSGNMYGTTESGGPYEVDNGGASIDPGGVLWEITTSGATYPQPLPKGKGVYKVIHSFGGLATDADGSRGPDGISPNGEIAFDHHGNLFGTTQNGGAHHAGMIWEVDASGTYKDVHDFGGTITAADGTSAPDGANPARGVTIDRDGDIFGTTQSGSAKNPFSGTVWEIVSDGTYHKLHDFGGTVTNFWGKSCADGSAPAADISFDSYGNTYGAATANDGAMVWTIAISGAYKSMHSFSGSSTPTGPYELDGADTVLTLDFTRNLYGTTPMGGANGGKGGCVWEIRSSGIYKDLHDLSATVTHADGTTGADGSLSATETSLPCKAVTFDNAGNMYGTTDGGGANDPLGGIVWEITSSGTYKDLHDFGGTVAYANGKRGPDGYEPLAGVIFDSGGNMYGTTSNGGANVAYGNIWEITADGTYKDLHDFGGTVINANGKHGPDGKSVHNIAFDTAGNIFGVSSLGGPYGETAGLSGAGMVWEITKSGVYEDLHDFGGRVAATK
jgi:hypothetical protein